METCPKDQDFEMTTLDLLNLSHNERMELGKNIEAAREGLADVINQHLKEKRLTTMRFALDGFKSMRYGSPKTLCFYVNNWKYGRPFGTTTWLRMDAPFTERELERVSSLLGYLSIPDNYPLLSSIKQVAPSFEYTGPTPKAKK